MGTNPPVQKDPPRSAADGEPLRLRHSLRRFDVAVMILSALISLDMVGQISSFGGQTFTWRACCTGR
ncbi:hypothetical protein TPAU25S_02517 [Tsukamurella paurometabola]|uniref:hypothetical protein n=1 Tax=Tsukamurella paurometabola TaxID=2061 RepID=UPI000DFE8FF2|nr:hypothetical protein [Tsukamurella paurometabola]SUP42501.1 Uncharacterised protein [Tsukamurella paurometabola]